MRKPWSVPTAKHPWSWLNERCRSEGGAGGEAASDEGGGGFCCSCTIGFPPSAPWFWTGACCSCTPSTPSPSRSSQTGPGGDKEAGCSWGTSSGSGTGRKGESWPLGFLLGLSGSERGHECGEPVEEDGGIDRAAMNTQLEVPPVGELRRRSRRRRRKTTQEREELRSLRGTFLLSLFPIWSPISVDTVTKESPSFCNKFHKCPYRTESDRSRPARTGQPIRLAGGQPYGATKKTDSSARPARPAHRAGFSRHGIVPPVTESTPPPSYPTPNPALQL